MPEAPDLSKCLEMNLSRAMDWLKFAETKNAALLGFCSALVATSSSRLSDWTNYRATLLLVMFGGIVGGIIAIGSFLPIRNREFSRSLRPKESANLIFFGDAAQFDAESYLERARVRYGIAETTAYQKDIADQIVIVSSIALRKFQMFDWAAYPVVITILMAAVLASSQFSP